MSKLANATDDLKERFLSALDRAGGTSNLQDLVAGIARVDQVYAAGIITHDMVRVAHCLRVAGHITIECDFKNRVDVIKTKK